MLLTGVKRRAIRRQEGNKRSTAHNSGNDVLVYQKASVTSSAIANRAHFALGLFITRAIFVIPAHKGIQPPQIAPDFAEVTRFGRMAALPMRSPA